MRYDIPAKPTVYAGVAFRSRLEATWAAFFDRLGWRWTYEPFDCRGWIPDFALASRLCAPRPVLVEVKPITALCPETTAKIDRADREHEVLLVGVGPDFRNGYIGWLRETFDDIEGGWWEPAPFGVWSGSESEWKNAERTIGFCHSAGRFSDRITGCYDGGSYGCIEHEALSRKVSALWGAAKATVQYRPR